jgi:Zn-dependent protease with chaperone function
MQLLVLAIVVGLFLHDSQPELLGVAGPMHGSAVGVSLGAKLVMALFYWWMCVRARRLMSAPGGGLALRRVEWAGMVYRQMVLVLYAQDLWYGMLLLIRKTIGDLILVDEMLVMLPSFGMVVWSWWAYYPIERRVREASLLRQLDSGQPVHAIWTRGQYVVFQARHQMTLVLVPLLALVGWMEAVNLYGPEYWELLHGDPRPLLSFAGSVGVFLLTPWLIRHVWDTVSLPEGALRRRLIDMCRQYRVGVRDLLLWRTHGGVINGAVMGLIAPLRYILLTDALLERMPGGFVEAVMAHELAHIRRHHMFWLATSAITSLVLMSVLWDGVGHALAPALSPAAVYAAAETAGSVGGDSRVIEWGVTVASVLSWVGLFGWISRRFERQADVFAVQHMSREIAVTGGELPGQPPVVKDLAVDVMSGALQLVADLNHISATRRSWRHGSIAWRQGYLNQMRGRRLDDLPIDRLILLIKATTAVLIGVWIALYFFAPDWLSGTV